MEPQCTVGGNEIGTATVENSTELLQTVKNEPAL